MELFETIKNKLVKAKTLASRHLLYCNIEDIDVSQKALTICIENLDGSLDREISLCMIVGCYYGESHGHKFKETQCII